MQGSEMGRLARMSQAGMYKYRQTQHHLTQGRSSTMTRLDSVRIVEVGPRDGLQSIQEQIPTATKLELIERLKDSGLSTIELTSLVSPKAVPQLADSQDVLGSLQIQQSLQNPALRLPVLVPNMKGLKAAVENGVKEIAVFVSAGEAFSKANINCSVEAALSRVLEVIYHASGANIAVRG